MEHRPDKERPKISIVTPCYNAAQFIHRLHESLARQDYQDFEWVLVDDCSTDNTVDVILGLAAPGQGGMQVYKLPENSGGGVALGFGVEKARGEIIIMVDHDDELCDMALSMASEEWHCIVTRSDIVGLFYRRMDPRLGAIIGEELERGTEFSMSWQTNVKPTITDGVFALKREIARDYFNASSLEGICLSGVPLHLMTQQRKLVAGRSRPFLIYRRDNPESQTNSVKISRKTVYTYSKYIDAYDRYYLRRPLYWMRHLVALIKFSMAVFGNPLYHHRYMESRLMRCFSYVFVPAGLARYLLSRKDSILNFPKYELSLLRGLEDLVDGTTRATALVRRPSRDSSAEGPCSGRFPSISELADRKV